MIRLTRAEEGDYRTPDGRWRILNPWMIDEGMEDRWLLMSWDLEYDGWQVLDDYGTLSEAIGSAREAGAGVRDECER